MFGAVGIRRTGSGPGGWPVRSDCHAPTIRPRTARRGGSGRGIRADWRVHLTSKGLTASEILPPLFGAIEQRWQERFGEAEISRLQQALQDVADQLEVELPHGLPGGYGDTKEYPCRVTRGESHLPLPTVLSQLLLAFRLELDRKSTRLNSS